MNNMMIFEVATRAYDNLTGSGELKLLRNRPLKNALAEYFAAAKVTAVVQATHEMELVHTFQPYIIERLDYAAVKRDLVRNTVVQKWVITTDLLDQYRSMLDRTNELLAMLE
jgi:hypothetical protein